MNRIPAILIASIVVLAALFGGFGLGLHAAQPQIITETVTVTKTETVEVVDATCFNALTGVLALQAREQAELREPWMLDAFNGRVTDPVWIVDTATPINAERATLDSTLIRECKEAHQ